MKMYDMKDSRGLPLHAHKEEQWVWDSFPCPAHIVAVVYMIGHVWRSISLIGPADPSFPMQGPVDCALKTLREEGILKFYTGFPTYCVRCAHPEMAPALRTNSHPCCRCTGCTHTAATGASCPQVACLKS